jgi:superfamily II DNA or RNA helicase
MPARFNASSRHCSIALSTTCSRHRLCLRLGVSEHTNRRRAAGSDVFVRGRRWTVLSETDFADCRALRVTGSDPFDRSIVRTLLLPFDRPRDIDSAATRVVRPRRWLRLLQRAAVDARPFGGVFPAAAGDIDIHGYQLEPALAMLRGGRTRILIADAVGLGKTIQAGLILRQLSIEQESFRALVVVPASLRDQWAGELEARFDIHPNVATTPWLAQAARDLPAEVSPWGLPAIYITSFEFIRRPEVLRPLEETGWDLLVVDEAHVATPGSDRRSAVHAVALRSRRVVLLTATPHGGDDDHFLALCHIGHSDARPDRIFVFQRSRHDVGIPQRRRTVLLAVRLSESERRTHRLLEQYAARLCAAARSRGDNHARLLAMVLRKRALSSVSALARSCRKRLALLDAGSHSGHDEQRSLPLDDEAACDDDVPETILAGAGLANIGRERRWLHAIVAVAQSPAARESKVLRLKRLLVKIRESAIVFTEYRDTLVRLEHELRPSYPHISMLHGGMTSRERSLVQQQFTQTGGLLLATDAAAEGLNLQHRCRTVIHFELPWSPARLEQRTGRVDRIGQTHIVHNIVLVASDTAERLVLAPLVRRAARARRVMPADAHLLDKLSESRVASAILDGASLDPGSASFDADTLRPSAELGRAAQDEAVRIGEVRRWSRTARRGGSKSGIAAAGINVTRGFVRGGVIRVYKLTLSAENGAIMHTELVAVHEARDISHVQTPSDVRAEIRALNLHGADQRQRLLDLFQSRITDVCESCARVGAALSEREMVVSAPVRSAAQQLVQRGLFDRRSEGASDNRARVNTAILDEATHRMRSFNSWGRAVPSFSLYAILLVSNSTHR